MSARGAQASARAGRRLAVVVSLVGIAATACGARLPGDVKQQAANAVLHARHGGTAPSTESSDGVNPSPTTPADVPTSGSGTAAPVVTAGQSTSGSGGPVANASSTARSAADCSGGTDVGLTASSLTLGAVATLSGPVSGLFEGTVQGGEAFANYVNSTSGGICGRRVKVDVADDGTNCTQDENATQNLISKAFALSGSFALYDGCGATVIKKSRTVADIHVALDAEAQRVPNHFDIGPNEPGFQTGMFAYYKAKLGSKLDHVGTIVENIPSAVAQQANMVHSAEAEGWHFVDTILEQPTNSNFQGDFVKLCQQQHIQVLFEVTEPAGNAATMIQNERQAGCPKSLVNIIPIAYDQAFLHDYAGSLSDLNGILGWNSYALFFNTDAADETPEVKTFQEWFARTYPGQPIDLYAMYAWADDRLLQEAAEHAGPILNRKTLIASLRHIKDFDSNGLIAPVSPGVPGGPHCYILWKLENGEFERVDDPKTGYRCDSKFLPRPTR